MEENIKQENPAGSRNFDTTMEVLFEISLAVSNTSTLEDFYKAIHTSLGKIINVDNFYIAMMDWEEDYLSFPYFFDEKDEAFPGIFNFSTTPSLTGKIIKSETPRMFTEKEIQSIVKSRTDGLVGTPSKIWLGAPLKLKNKVTGAIVVQSYKYPDLYHETDLKILTLVAQHIAIAIEKKQSDEVLKQQSSILEKILETSPVGICLVGNRVFKWVNTEMVKIFGYKGKEDFKDKSTQMIYPSIEDYTRAGDVLYSELTRKNRADIDINMIRKDGSIFPGHIQLGSADSSDPMAWTIATITDISIRKHAEEEKSKNERLKVVLEMAGAVCHELNQPLQAILGYSELIMLDREKEFSFYNEVEAIQRQTERISKITKKLSSITKYKTRKYPGNTKIVDIWDSGPDKK